MRAIVVALSATCVLSTGSAGQRAPSREGSQKDSTAIAAVEGTYALSFTPANQEPLTGRIEIQRKEGRPIAIFTSAKLNGPLEADSLAIVNDHVFASILHGGYTFEFRVQGDAVLDARFSKSVKGKALETGPADIRRVHDTSEK